MADFLNALTSQTQYYSNTDAVIVFIKNPQLGKVKTRLAATVGNERALKIYHILMQHTNTITRDLLLEKYLFYSDFIDKKDIWENQKFHKFIQHQGQDLGVKIASAFLEIFEKKHKKILIIGSDCLELNTHIIEEGHRVLSDNEVVIGPANDGGYYLIGFNFERLAERSKQVLENIFIGKQWSHEGVCQEAITACQQMNLSYFQLPILTDVDEEKDFLKTQHFALKYL